MEVDFHGYSIDSDGFIWNKNHTRPLAGSINKHGYHRVMLWYDDGYHYFTTHRLIAAAFVKNDDPTINTVVNHLDGNKLNNHYTNLEWTTISGNTKHAIQTGLYKTPDTSIKTVIENVKTGERWEFHSRKECEEYFGVEFRSICGSRQTKRFKDFREVK